MQQYFAFRQKRAIPSQRQRRSSSAGRFNINAPDTVWFQAKLAVKDNKLIAIRVPESESSSATQTSPRYPARPANRCASPDPVDFYICRTRHRSSLGSSQASNSGSKSPSRPKARLARCNSLLKTMAYGNR